MILHPTLLMLEIQLYLLVCLFGGTKAWPGLQLFNFP